MTTTTDDREAISTTEDARETLSVTEAARRAGRCRHTILNWIYKGRVAFGKKNGREYEIDAASLETRIKELDGPFLRRHE